MTTTDPVIIRVARANPVAPSDADGPADRRAAERVLARVLDDAGPASGRRHGAGRALVPALSAAVVILVAALFIRAGGHRSPGQATPGGAGSVITFQTMAGPRSGVTPRAIARELVALRARSTALGLHARIRSAPGGQILVTVARGSDQALVTGQLERSTNLDFYDWEANVLTPAGHTVASVQAGGQNRVAMAIGQGGGSGVPGTPGAGGMALYDAVRLAARQPVVAASPTLSRLGPDYYLFGSAGSAACVRAAQAVRVAAATSGHCLLAGPVQASASTPAATVRSQLLAQLGSGTPAGATELLAVPQGTVVLQASTVRPGQVTALADPSARFFVLRDRVGLSGTDITDPAAAADQSGSPDVQFTFTHAGAQAFQAITAQIAHRGVRISIGEVLDQHFAIALDGRLLTVPQIDYRQYPDGIVAVTGGADVTGGLTHSSARALAAELAAGALPLQLRPVG